MQSDRANLGAIVYELGKHYICERGIYHNQVAILWEAIDTLFLDAWKYSVNFIPTAESIAVEIVTTAGQRISLNQKASFRMRKEKQSNFYDIYQFIVSKIIDRQWNNLINDLKQGKRISFKSFDITSTAIYQKKLFRGYNAIELWRITNYKVENGEFYIVFVDAKGRLMRLYCGPVSKIPNVHLAQAFLLSIAQSNLEKMNITT